MRETREKKIDNKIFTKKDIINIWKSIEDLKKKNDNDKETKISMQIRCDDDTRYESTSDEFLQEGEIFDIKKVESIDFDYCYWTGGDSDRITISIKQGICGHCNFLVSGGNKNWVAGSFSKIESIINSLNPQKNIIDKYYTSLNIILIVFFDYIFLSIFIFLFHNHLQKITNLEFLFYIIPIITIFSAMLSSWPINRLLKLWPVIEFDFGPEHMKVEKQRRKKVWNLLTIVIIPLILGIITTLLTFFI